MTPSYFETYADADFDRQRPADVAVIMPTIIRPTMKEALQSVFRQAPARRIQILIGIDRPDGDVALIEAICAERPAHCCVNFIYPGYSTSVRHGGLHPAYDGRAALRFDLSGEQPLCRLSRRRQLVGRQSFARDARRNQRSSLGLCAALVRASRYTAHHLCRSMGI